MTESNPQLPKTAAEAYARHTRHIGALLGWLTDEIEVHAGKHRQRPRDWGYVGDMQELESLLKRALGQISGMEDPQIEQALADTEE